MKTKHKGIIIPDYFIAMKWISKGGKCMSDLQKEVNITYKHLHELKHTFIKMNWVDITKVKRRHIMSLTEKGKQVEKVINDFFNIMGIREEDVIKNINKSKIKKKEEIDIEKLKSEVFEYDN